MNPSPIKILGHTTEIKSGIYYEVAWENGYNGNKNLLPACWLEQVQHKEELASYLQEIKNEFEHRCKPMRKELRNIRKSSCKSAQIPQDEFKVKKIIGRRRFSNDLKFHVKWAGENKDEKSWEPVENLQNCPLPFYKFSKKGYKEALQLLPILQTEGFGVQPLSRVEEMDVSLHTSFTSQGGECMEIPKASELTLEDQCISYPSILQIVQSNVDCETEVNQNTNTQEISSQGDESMEIPTDSEPTLEDEYFLDPDILQIGQSNVDCQTEVVQNTHAHEILTQENTSMHPSFELLHSPNADHLMLSPINFNSLLPITMDDQDEVFMDWVLSFDNSIANEFQDLLDEYVEEL